MKMKYENLLGGILSILLIFGSINMAMKNPSVEGWGWICLCGIVLGGLTMLNSIEIKKP